MRGGRKVVLPSFQAFSAFVSLLVAGVTELKELEHRIAWREEQLREAEELNGDDGTK